jgi:hypothetical protein
MVTSLRSKWAEDKAVRAGLAVGARISESIRKLIRRLPDDVIIIVRRHTSHVSLK